MLRKVVLAVAVVGVCALPTAVSAVAAQEAEEAPQANVSLPRMPSISPDGQTIVFSWHGDLWKVPVAGGNAIRLTSHPAEETYSAFSPDGTRIAFNSDRVGSAGLYTMNADGTGVVEVLGFDRTALLVDWADTGEEAGMLYFTGYIEPDIYRNPRPYRIDAAGGVYERVHDAFGRDPVLEPNGNRVLFTRGNASWSRRHYRGPDARDVWLYDPEAQDPFVQLTDWAGNDGRTRWVGKDKFIYTSDRSDRTVNLYLADLGDGEQAEEDARRLTFFDDRDVEEFDVSADGKTVVFARWDQLFTLDLTDENAEPQPLSITAAEDERDNVDFINIANQVDEAALSPDGKTMAFIAYGQLYVRGTEENSASRRISDSLARHRDIAWSPDGGTLYFSSDESGREAIYAATATRTRSEIVEQIEAYHEATDTTTHPSTNSTTRPSTQPATRPAAAVAGEDPLERGRAEDHAGPDPAKWPDAIAFNIELVSESEAGDSAPIPAPDARRLAFTRGVGDLWVLDLESGEETRIFNGWSSDLDVIWTYDARHLLFTTDDADFNTDIWVTRADGTGWRGEGEPVNITRHPQGDVNMSISHDGRILTFASSRGGEEYDVYRVYLDEELEALAPVELEEYHKSLAERVKESKLPKVPAWARERGSVSPLVKALSTRPTGEQATEAATRAATQAAGVDTDDEGATTQPTTRPVTQPAAGADEPPRFSINQVRQALRQFILEEPEDDDAGDPRPTRQVRGEEEQPTLDDFPLEEAYLRLDRVAGGANRPLLLPDASAVYYASREGTFRRPWNGSPSRIGDGVSLAGMTPRGDRIFYVNNNSGGYFNTSGSQANRLKSLSPSDRLEVDLAEMNERKFLAMARTLGAQFYHPTMKGLDWGKLTEEHLPLARAARTPEEFSHVAMKLLGELNASHLGVYPPGAGQPAQQSFGHLGIRSEPVENGFEVKEVLETGPAGRGPMRLQAGDIITHLELEPVEADRPLELQLADRVGREIVVGISRGGRHLDLLIEPVDYGRINALSYDAWRLANQRKVEELSEGRLGYIHIRGMDQGSLDIFVRDLYAAAHDKDGLIIDVRNNGGGWTTDRLLASIMYPRHAFTIPRGMRDSTEAGRATAATGGYPNDRLFIPRYDLPINMLCNEKSFSNAEIVSHAFKTLDRGTLVGEETAGGVISTGSFTLVDGTRVRLPFRGWYLPDGRDMENNGAVPDLRIPQTPEAESAGEDEQLQAAVEDLLSRL